jgi:hypothetical protein
VSRFQPSPLGFGAEFRLCFRKVCDRLVFAISLEISGGISHLYRSKIRTYKTNQLGADNERVIPCVRFLAGVVSRHPYQFEVCPSVKMGDCLDKGVHLGSFLNSVFFGQRPGSMPGKGDRHGADAGAGIQTYSVKTQQFSCRLWPRSAG